MLLSKENFVEYCTHAARQQKIQVQFALAKDEYFILFVYHFSMISFLRFSSMIQRKANILYFWKCDLLPHHQVLGTTRSILSA